MKLFGDFVKKRYLCRKIINYEETRYINTNPDATIRFGSGSRCYSANSFWN